MRKLRKTLALLLLELACMAWPYDDDVRTFDYAWEAYGWMRGSLSHRGRIVYDSPDPHLPGQDASR